MSADEPTLTFATPEAWAAWLADEHERATGAWLRLARKGCGEVTVTRAEALEVALCHGWIDARSGRGDATHWLQRFTPRRPRSTWSRINREAATALIARGAMLPAGLREVEAAKADGRWERAYASPRAATVPDDLRAALAAEPRAAAEFARLDGRNRYAVLHRIETAKRPETRARRIATFTALLRDGGRLHP